jgi:hypothetical protein
MNVRYLPRRSAVFATAAVALALAAGCPDTARCATCGMKIDSASPWVSYVTINDKEEPFDTPSCAFSAWRKAGAHAGPARFREYYSQQMKPADELRFVRNSDVVGPMGPDLVPVSAETARRFARDHNGAPPQSAEEILRGEAP